MQLGDGSSGRARERILRRYSLSQARAHRALKTDETVSKVQVKAHEFPILKQSGEQSNSGTRALHTGVIILMSSVYSLL